MIATLTVSRRPERYVYVLREISQQMSRPNLAVFVVPKNHLEAACSVLGQGMNQLGINYFVLSDESEKCYGGYWNLGFGFASKLMERGLMFSMDDDNWHGPVFITEAEEMFKVRPDAGIIGKACYYTKWMYGNMPVVLNDGPVKYKPGDRVTWVAGDTIAINVDIWNKNPGFRPDPNDCWGDVSLLKSANDLGIPIYTTGRGNYYYQRFPKDHGHVWNEPEPAGI